MQGAGVGSLLQDQETSILQLSSISFHNAVEKDNQWRGAVTNQDDEHVAAIVNSKDDHRVYIWDQKWGKLVKILEGNWQFIVLQLAPLGQMSSSTLNYQD